MGAFSVIACSLAVTYLYFLLFHHPRNLKLITAGLAWMFLALWGVIWWMPNVGPWEVAIGWALAMLSFLIITGLVIMFAPNRHWDLSQDVVGVTLDQVSFARKSTGTFIVLNLVLVVLVVSCWG